MTVAQALAQTRYEPAHVAAAKLAGLNVLVVEDDNADAYLIECALQADPRVADIRIAADGIDAMEMLERGDIHPDLAVIDLHMPRMDGFRLLVELSCRNAAAFPMIVLTSSSARADLIRGKLRGADMVLTKPDTLSKLINTLQRAITTI